MRLVIHVIDEREAFKLRAQGWQIKRMDGSAWELHWPDPKTWPPDPNAEPTLPPGVISGTYGMGPGSM